MRAHLRILLAVLLIALITAAVGASQLASASPSHTARACGPGLEAVPDATGRGCTHGGDPVEAFGSTGAQTTVAFPDAPCAAGGRRVRVFYGYPSGTANRVATYRATIVQIVAETDYSLGASGAAGYHYRWFCSTAVPPQLKITPVKLVAIGSDGQFTFADYVKSMQNQVSLGLGTRDYLTGKTDYLTFIDNLGSAYPYGGQGYIEDDDRADPAVNINNSDLFPKYALVKFVPGWGNAFLALVGGHETSHNLGAVQLSSPQSSGAWHCYDEYDLMCYDDGGPYFQKGGTLKFLCPDSLGTGAESDCNHDDYFNAAPPAGSYLETHWNLANSSWLTH